MTPIINEAKTLVMKDYGSGQVYWYIWCPACQETHLFNSKMNDSKPGWQWNQNLEFPSFTPSLRYLSRTKCHITITNGMIKFHGDCLHSMAGQTVPLPQIPQDYLDMFL